MKTRAFDSRKGKKWNPPRSPDMDLNQALRDLVEGQDREALKAWRERCYSTAKGAYFDAKPLVRALQFGGSPWAVLELLAMGETPTPESVMRCLDTCAQTVQAGPDSPTFLRHVEVWHAFLDTVVKADPDLKKEAMLFVATIPSVIAGPRVPNDLDQEGMGWDHLRLGEVFTPEAWSWNFEWSGPNSDDPEAYLRASVPVSALQLAWAHECWNVCFHLLRGGLSATQTFPSSCWPAWTLKAALSGDKSWMEGVNGLALVDARAVAGRQHKAHPSLDRLKACIREQEMDVQLPSARSAGVGRRF